MKNQTSPTLTSLIATNITALFLLLLLILCGSHGLKVASIIAFLGIITLLWGGYPKAKEIVIHYKLTHLVNNKGPQLQSFNEGSSFHLNGVQMNIVTAEFREGEEGGAPYKLIVIPAAGGPPVTLAYPSLLPHGGEEFERNLAALRKIYAQYGEVKSK